jgi:chitinase
MTPEERAYAAADVAPDPGPEATRRLSWLRILGLIAVIVAAVAATVGFRSVTHHKPIAAPRSSFMPYVDVTATPQYPFEDASKSTSANLVLGFVVSSKSNACDPSWGGAYSLDQASTAMDLDRRIVRLRERGGQVAISFGGAANSELATGCTDPAQLLAAYRSVVQRYSIYTIDLDIEGAAASAPAVDARRAQAIAALQQAQHKAGKTLQVWLTLPVDPSGLTAAGKTAVADMLAAKVKLAGVNALTMDYGQSRPAGESMLAASESALTSLDGQLTSAYDAAGSRINSRQAWQLIGATPMIGQNDVSADRFDLDDAHQLLAFAQAHHLRRLSMWSVNRDLACGPNYANVAIVSVNCSGVAQRPAQFTKIFSHFRAGAAVLAPTPKSALASDAPTSLVDNPATSPYPIWNPAVPYVAATKIVWHHNVYQAKWWTEGDTPDQPVATASDTPWTLIGPVLPGEHPAPTPTVAAGTYPQWSATKTYVAGQKVIYEGIGYEAKWYTQGDVPGIVVSDPGQTPWELITSS